LIKITFIAIVFLTIASALVKRFMRSTNKAVQPPKSNSSLPSEEEILQKAKQNAEQFSKK